MSYQKGRASQVIEEYLDRELNAIQTAFTQVTNPKSLQFNEVYAEPERPRNGMTVFADGSTWNPGSGRGLYIYDGTAEAWVQIVAL